MKRLTTTFAILFSLVLFATTGFAQQTGTEMSQKKQQIKQMMQDSTMRAMMMEHMAQNPKMRKQMMKRLMQNMKTDEEGSTGLKKV